MLILCQTFIFQIENNLIAFKNQFVVIFYNWITGIIDINL